MFATTLYPIMAIIELTINWLLQYQIELLWLGLVSIITFLSGLFVMPWVILRLPEDYFLRTEGDARVSNRSVAKIFIFVVKNVTGSLLVCIGFLMLFLPGPGVLVALIGFVLVDVAGKRRVIVWVLRVTNLREIINKFRSRQGMAPFKFEE